MRNSTVAIGVIISALVLAGFYGCVTVPSFGAADCQCYKYKGYTVCVCNDDSVNHYCHKHGATWDDGTPLKDDRFIRACARKGWANRKARIWVGQSYVACLPHEICHLEGFSPSVCERDFPCIGDRQ